MRLNLGVSPPSVRSCSVVCDDIETVLTLIHHCRLCLKGPPESTKNVTAF